MRALRSLLTCLALSGPAFHASSQTVAILEGYQVAYTADRYGPGAANGIPKDYVKIPPAREYYLDYQVYFENDWEWVKGGKLPGLVGGKHTSGCNDIEADGWSARFMWHENGGGHFYYYHQNRRSGCGDSRNFANGRTFKKNAWNRITERVVVNTPGQADGLAQAWLNGEKVVDVGGLRWRGNVAANTALVDQVSLQTFYGGSGSSWAPSRTTHARFSPLVVRTDLPDFSRPFDPTSGIRTPPSLRPLSARRPGDRSILVDVRGRTSGGAVWDGVRWRREDRASGPLGRSPAGPAYLMSVTSSASSTSFTSTEAQAPSGN